MMRLKKELEGDIKALLQELGDWRYKESIARSKALDIELQITEMDREHSVLQKLESEIEKESKFKTELPEPEDFPQPEALMQEALKKAGVVNSDSWMRGLLNEC